MKQRKLAIITAVIETAMLLIIISFAQELFSLFFLISLLLFCPIFVAYWAIKNLGSKDAGQLLARIIGAFLVLIVLVIIFDKFWFFKADAKGFLLNDGITLTDPFEMSYNDNSGDYHRFELKISKRDKDRIMHQLQQSKFFISPCTIQLRQKMNGRLSDAIYLDHELPEFIIREKYKRDDIGYASIADIITVYKNKNFLIFERYN